MIRSSSNRPSSPMDIPVRKHRSKKITSKSATSMLGIQGEQQGPSKTETSKHDPRKVRPAVAALLAMTSIPPPRSQRNRRDSQQRQQQGLQYHKQSSRPTSHVTIDELVEEWKSEDNILAASAENKSPISVSLMNTLMEPPNSMPHFPHNSYPSGHGVIPPSSGKPANESGSVAGRRISRGRSARTSSTTSRETNLSVLSTSSCTSLETSMSSNSLSSLLDGDAEGEKDSEGVLSPDSLSIDDLSIPSSLRHRFGSLTGKRTSIEKKELLSSPAIEFVDIHPLLSCSEISSSRVAADWETAGMRDGTEHKGLRIADDPVNTSASTDSSPTRNTYPTTEIIRPVTNDMRNAFTTDPAQQSDSPSSFTTLTASFKSNLTASFNALASAARSFSNFTAPSLPPDDLLTRSLLAPNPSIVQYQTVHYPSARFPSEMRPKPIHGVPEPALRRYLNPGIRTTTLSPSKALGTGARRRELERIRNAEEISRVGAEVSRAAPLRALPADLPSRHDFVRQVQQMGTDEKNRRIRRKDKFNSDEVSFTECENYEEMIPLKPFNRPVTGSNNITRPSQSQLQAQHQQQLPSPPSSPPSFSSSSTLQNPTYTSRPREPRENSDFLRIVVLEMNMRRVGKLDSGATGKARIWLPPRRESENCDSGTLLARNYRRADEVVGPHGLGGSGGADGADGEAKAKMMTMIPRRWIGQVPPAAAVNTTTTA